MKAVRILKANLRRRFPRPEPNDVEGRTRIVIAVRKSVIVLFVWMFVLTLAVTFTLYKFHSQATAARRQAAATSRQAYQQCERTRHLAPPVASAYARYHILTPAELKLYRMTIPRSC